MLSRDTEVGSAVSSILTMGSGATLIMTLGDLSEVYVKGKVDESDIAKIYGPGGLQALLPNGPGSCASPTGMPAPFPTAGQIPYGPLTPMPRQARRIDPTVEIQGTTASLLCRGTRW